MPVGSEWNRLTNFLVSRPRLVSSRDFSSGERVFLEGEGEAGPGARRGVEGERAAPGRARLVAALTGVRKPSASSSCGELSRLRRRRARPEPWGAAPLPPREEEGVAKRAERELCWEEEGEGVTASRGVEPQPRPESESE